MHLRKQENEMSTATITDTERIAIQVATVARHLEMENAGMTDTVMAETFATEGVFYDVVPAGAHFEGVEAVQGFYDVLFATLPDIKIVMTHEYDVVGCCVREGYVTGTHSAEFAGVPASGNFVSFPFCAMYIFGDDPTKLIAERAYWDNENLVAQFKGEAPAVTDYPWNTGK
jgi:steroid delta-isomerase-like uncharacterized protein